MFLRILQRSFLRLAMEIQKPTDIHTEYTDRHKHGDRRQTHRKKKIHKQYSTSFRFKLTE
jgi:hypothetical protein